MKHRQLEAFQTVMVSGSTVRAAELMGVTQPAVSRLIAELENSVRFALFDRVQGRLIATPEARLFFREVEASFRGLDRLRSAAAAIRDHGSGALRFGCFAAGSVDLAPAAIRAFRTRHPRVRMTLHVTWSSAIRDGVVDGTYDIGLAADEIDRSGIVSQPFYVHSGQIVMPADHPLARHEVIRPEHLAGVPLLGLAPEDRARQRMDTVLQEAGVTPEYIVETPNSSTICALAASGDAVGLVNPIVTGSLGPDLALRPFAPQVQFRSLLLFPAHVQKSLLLKDFEGELLRFRGTGA